MSEEWMRITALEVKAALDIRTNQLFTGFTEITLGILKYRIECYV